MASLFKGVFELILIGVFVFFLFVSYKWITTNPLNDSNSVIALATIVYAFFTFFMFWNMKSSSENNIRPFLVTNFDDNLNLHLTNKLDKNQAINVKIRVKAIPMRKFKEDSPYTKLLHKYVFAREWNFIQDYLGSYKNYYETFNGFTKLDLLDYISSKISVTQSNSKRSSPIIIPKVNDEVIFKLLVSISYDSLLDINYDLNDKYIVRVKKDCVKIDKIL